MKKFFAMLLIAVMCVFSLTACLENVRILGTWSTEDKGTTMTFDKDGTGSIKLGDSFSYTYDMTYTVDGTTLEITTTATILGFSSSSTQKYEISFEKGNLVLTDADNSDSVLTLIKQ
ncbi:MAG: hypothetical protein K6B75_05110 [Lachnospiraceae bacterium]|nr:hypothetical protein [Lachnospiraceae bacterium]